MIYVLKNSQKIQENPKKNLFQKILLILSLGLRIFDPSHQAIFSTAKNIKIA